MNPAVKNPWKEEPVPVTCSPPWRAPLTRLALTALLACGVVSGCKGQGKPTESQPTLTLVEVAPAVSRSFRGLVPITGELRPMSEVTLKSRIGGVVTELTVDEGDRVRKGQLIARIEDQSPQASLRNARAAVGVAEAGLARAQAELERLQREKGRLELLHGRGAADQRSLDDSRTALRLGEANVKLATAQVAQASAGYQSAQVAVSDTRYYAPFDGVISRRGVSRYEYLDTMKSRDIVTVVDNTAMDLNAAVAADLAGGVVVGAKVDFQVNGVSAPIHGELVAVNPSVDPRTRTVKLRARIQNPEGRLKGGMYATGTVTIGGERVGVGVPLRALQLLTDAAARERSAAAEPSASDQAALWRVRDGAVEQLKVRVGVRDDSFAEILSGLAAGDQVVVSNPAALRPGLAVKAKPAAGF